MVFYEVKGNHSKLERERAEMRAPRIAVSNELNQNSVEYVTPSKKKDYIK